MVSGEDTAGGALLGASQAGLIGAGTGRNHLKHRR